MKTDRHAKVQAQLRDAETRLRARLLVLLPDAAQDGRALFTNSEFNSNNLLASHLSAEAEWLLRESRRCLELRGAANLSPDGSVGRLFLDACFEAAGSDPHRRGPRRLAAALLDAVTRDA